MPGIPFQRDAAFTRFKAFLPKRAEDLRIQVIGFRLGFRLGLSRALSLWGLDRHLSIHGGETSRSVSMFLFPFSALVRLRGVARDPDPNQPSRLLRVRVRIRIRVRALG